MKHTSIVGPTTPLRFSLKRYFNELAQLLQDSSKRDWYKTRGKYDVIRTTFLLAKEMELRQFYYPIWLKRFSGKIPNHWAFWRNVLSDLEAARVAKIKLDGTLIDAAVSHPVIAISRRSGVTQPLNSRQLAWLLAKPSLVHSQKEIEEILLVQRKFGMSKSDQDDALKIVERVQHKLLKWRIRINSLEIPEMGDAFGDVKAIQRELDDKKRPQK